MAPVRGQAITVYRQQRVDSVWTLGGPESIGGRTIKRDTVNVSHDISLVRAMAAKANVVVDIQVARVKLTDQATSIATQILDRIPSRTSVWLKWPGAR